MTDFLIHKKFLHVCPLIPTQLNNLFIVLILLNGSVAREIFLKCLTYALNIQVVRKTSYGGDTFSSVTLLNTNVNLVSLGRTGLISGVLERVCALDT